MKITFLGTGTSQGIPVINCTCEVCQSPEPRNKRLRTSAWIQTERNSILIDIGPDFRQQALKNSIQRIDALLLTHEHADHTAGLDDIRPINFAMGAEIPLYAESRVIADLQKRYHYIFGGSDYPGLPKLELVPVIINKSFSIHGDIIFPFRVMHGKLGILGFRISDFVYITDAGSISEDLIEELRHCKVLVINALRNKEHHSHLSLAQAIEIIERIQPGRAFLTHISHQLGLHEVVGKKLDSTIQLAYDNLQIEC